MLVFVGLFFLVLTAFFAYRAFKLRFQRTNRFGVQEFASAGAAVRSGFVQRGFGFLCFVCFFIGALALGQSVLKAIDENREVARKTRVMNAFEATLDQHALDTRAKDGTVAAKKLVEYLDHHVMWTISKKAPDSLLEKWFGDEKIELKPSATMIELKRLFEAYGTKRDIEGFLAFEEATKHFQTGAYNYRQINRLQDLSVYDGATLGGEEMLYLKDIVKAIEKNSKLSELLVRPEYHNVADLLGGFEKAEQQKAKTMGLLRQ